MIATEPLLQALRHHRYRFASEEELQAGVEFVLWEAGIIFRREADLGAGGRIDFITEDRVGIEVKTEGSPAAVARQLVRYAQVPSVRSLILVTSRAGHWMRIGPLRSMLGTPVEVVRVNRGALA